MLNSREIQGCSDQGYYILRLELTAAVVSVKVSCLLKRELDYKNVTEFFWTDSKVVLGYIHNEARRFHTSVSNRIQFIREKTTLDQWSYVPTEQNPADHASRGLIVNELCNSTWLRGASFLWKPEYFTVDLAIGDPEVRSTQAFAVNVHASFSVADHL